MSEKKFKWHKIAESKEELFSSGNALVELNVNHKTVCVGIYQDRLFGCAYKCPHAGGTMAGGWLDAMGNIVCPLHRYRFNPMNGRNVSGEGYYLNTYPVEIKEDGIYMGMEEKKGWF